MLLQSWKNKYSDWKTEAATWLQTCEWKEGRKVIYPWCDNWRGGPGRSGINAGHSKCFIESSCYSALITSNMTQDWEDQKSTARGVGQPKVHAADCTAFSRWKSLFFSSKIRKKLTFLFAASSTQMIHQHHSKGCLLNRFSRFSKL